MNNKFERNEEYITMKVEGDTIGPAMFKLSIGSVRPSWECLYSYIDGVVESIVRLNELGFAIYYWTPVPVFDKCEDCDTEAICDHEVEVYGVSSKYYKEPEEERVKNEKLAEEFIEDFCESRIDGIKVYEIPLEDYNSDSGLIYYFTYIFNAIGRLNAKNYKLKEFTFNSKSKILSLAFEKCEGFFGPSEDDLCEDCDDCDDCEEYGEEI